MDRQFGARLVTVEPLCAVRMQNGTPGLITRIPRYSTLRPLSQSRIPQMVEIDWQGEHYAAFEVDLRERCADADGEPGRPLPMRQARIA
jgi:hypothetical protein